MIVKFLRFYNFINKKLNNNNVEAQRLCYYSKEFTKVTEQNNVSTFSLVNNI